MPDEVEVPNTPPPAEEIPLPPEPPAAPGEEEHSVSLKVPESQTGPETAASSETSESDAEELPESEPDEDTEEDSQDATDPAEGEEAADEEVPKVPVVNNNPDNQTVTMPDGRVIFTRSHGNPVSNTEQASYELTHYGDQQRYSLVPGDEGYSPYSDPAVPNSHLAQMVEREISGYGERVLLDPNAPVSSMWNGLHGVYEGELAHAVSTDVGSGNVEA